MTPPRLRTGGDRLVLAPLVVLCCLLLVAISPAAGAGPEPAGTWPLDPRPEVVATFAPPDDPWGPGHRGVDLAGRVGQPVRSALPGAVAFAGRVAGKPVVTVSHGETRTTYEPVVALLEVGTSVAAGAVIGVLELPASHCFPRACLHWGWRRGEAYLDPLALMGGGPVRLLPLWRDEPVPSGPGAGWRQPVHPYGAWSPRVTLLRSPVPSGAPAPPPGGRSAGSLP